MLFKYPSGKALSTHQPLIEDEEEKEDEDESRIGSLLQALASPDVHTPGDLSLTPRLQPGERGDVERQTVSTVFPDRGSP